VTYDRILPYNKELLEPQRDLLTYVMKQLYSKDLVTVFCFPKSQSFECELQRQRSNNLQRNK
jgi:hypothetical protein